MHKRRNALLAGLMGLMAQWSGAAWADHTHSRIPEGQKLAPWAVYYSDKAPLERFRAFNLLVLDSLYHPPLPPLADAGKLLLGYISLGEVEQHRDHYAAVKAEGILMQENENWPGSFFVDVRDKRWTKRVVEELIPDILHAGFHGLFLDTLDNPGHLESSDPTKYAGMRDAAARMIHTIRLHYPHMPIMLNRAYDLLPLVGDAVDMALGESVRADYNFQTKTYQMVEETDYVWQVNQLKSAAKQFPHLKLFTLDYWDPQDKAGITRIYQQQRAQGFIPSVATVELDRIIDEPR
ncbi:hypothetical protein MAIT1_03034 [Magnetofaba australis IT-1]|uniref:Glycoside-hydrolase family GH114 TIM-barrel domain-containing protein n=2 Tax=Magnetofaba TaxID=1472292 RepID=A0A1Y2K820_9PROT|nr:hypothetical protein MAIT1_03034 [Magnetofaba australis IT-1]